MIVTPNRTKYSDFQHKHSICLLKKSMNLWKIIPDLKLVKNSSVINFLYSRKWDALTQVKPMKCYRNVELASRYGHSGGLEKGSPSKGLMLFGYVLLSSLNSHCWKTLWIWRLWLASEWHHGKGFQERLDVMVILNPPLTYQSMKMRPLGKCVFYLA